MASKATFRRAAAEDAAVFYREGIPLSFRGWVAEQDGVVTALFGISYEHGIPVAFSQIADPMRSCKKSIAKGCRILMKMLDSIRGPVYAVADPNEPTAPYLLIKLGWRPTGRFTPHGELMARSTECS